MNSRLLIGCPRAVEAVKVTDRPRLNRLPADRYEVRMKPPSSACNALKPFCSGAELRGACLLYSLLCDGCMKVGEIRHDS